MIEVGQVRLVTTQEWHCWGPWENREIRADAVTQIGQKIIVKAFYERAGEQPSMVQFLDIHGRTWYTSPALLEKATQVL